MTEPTDAEIQAAMEAVTADATSRLPDHDHEVVTSVVSGMRPVIEVALRAVLPDHDARVRAEERAKVAEAQRRIADAKRGLFARIIASAHLLDKPFVNAPDQSPWTRMKAAMGALGAAIDDLDARIARQHVARPITDFAGAAPTAHDGSKWETPARCRSRIRTPRIDACTRDAGHTGRHRSGGHEWTDTAPGAFLPRIDREETP